VGIPGTNLLHGNNSVRKTGKALDLISSQKTELV
jgi:hypothetical protein